MKNKKIDAIWGFIVGDALGVPYEFTKPIVKKLEMVGFGTHNQAPGTWSDDTSFLLATLDSERELESIKQNYFRVLDGVYSIDNFLFDVGAGTTEYLNQLENSGSTGKENESKGNGSIMRVLPFAISEEIDLLVQSTMFTHKNDESLINSLILYNLYKYLLNGGQSEWAVKYYLEGFDINDENLSLNGYVEDSFNISAYFGLTCKSFDDCMLKVINLGGDTDTHCAIAGSIAAIRFGVPQKWIKKIRGKEMIERIIKSSVWLK